MTTIDTSCRTSRGRTLDVASIVLSVVLAVALHAPAANAGCGCEKAPPDLSSVRPNATYGGTQVTLFSPSFIVGSSYIVEFSSGTSTTKASVTTTAVSRRDLADGVNKPQLVVTLPSSLPLGPTRITARRSGQTTLLVNLSDDAFTVVPLPVVVPEAVGSTNYANFKAAIGRDGTFYIALDMTGVTQPRVYQAQALGYPLVFASDDVVFYNTQGFLMQLLNQDMPGLSSVISSATSANSSLLGYSRHEFSTYYLQHSEQASHTVLEGNWHNDGTRHINHDHLILAITGSLYNGTQPVPGSTPAFTLRMERTTLFHHGLVATSTATDAVNMSNNARTDSYDSRTGVAGYAGDIRTNGTLNMTNTSVLDGKATAKAFNVAATASITGVRTTTSQSETFLGVKLPDFLTDLGALTLNSDDRMTLTPGSYLVQTSLTIQNDAELYINNCAGPVTMYVSGSVTVQDKGQIVTCSTDPEQFALYIDGNQPVQLKGSDATIYGVIYAPQSLVKVQNFGVLYGSVVSGKLDFSNNAVLHYDVGLRGQVP